MIDRKLAGLNFNDTQETVPVPTDPAFRPAPPPTERLGPPGDVSASCNSSHCAITWAQPPTWAPMTAQDFRFEIEWKVGGVCAVGVALWEGRPWSEHDLGG